MLACLACSASTEELQGSQKSPKTASGTPGSVSISETNALAALLLASSPASAFNPSAGQHRLSVEKRRFHSDPVMNIERPPFNRRAALHAMAGLAALPAQQAFAAATGGGFTKQEFVPEGPPMPKELKKPKPPSKTSCSTCVPTDEELYRLAIGYKRLKFLLENWDAETTVCIRGCEGTYESCGCDKNPVVVQEYMGFKSMLDPMFAIDKLMLRAQDKVKDKDFNRYQKLYDRWNEKSEEGNVMAYISSWGEANPGGGKDRVKEFLEKAKKSVLESAYILREMCTMLEVPIA